MSKSTSTPRKSEPRSGAGKRPETGKSQAARRSDEPAETPADPAKATSGKGSRPAKAGETPDPAPPAAPGNDPAVLPPAHNGVPFGEAPVPPRQQGVDRPGFLMSTSARMAEAARSAVWAISSEKTTGQFEAAEERAREIEEVRQEDLAVAKTTAVPAEDLRRGAKDLYSFFRVELQRPEREDDPHASWRAYHRRQRHELLPGIPVDELRQIEERLAVTLPPSYWDFSLEWQGGLLYVREHAYTRILSAREILDEVKRALCDTMLRPYLPVVDLGCGDYLALDTSKAKGEEFPLVWWSCGDPRKKVAESFAAWLKRYIEADGDPYWWA